MKDPDDLDATSFFPSSYAKWLKSNDIQVVPLDIYSSIDEIKEILGACDGLLLPGGAIPLLKHDNVIRVDEGD